MAFPHHARQVCQWSSRSMQSKLTTICVLLHLNFVQKSNVHSDASKTAFGPAQVHVVQNSRLSLTQDNNYLRKIMYNGKKNVAPTWSISTTHAPQ